MKTSHPILKVIVPKFIVSYIETRFGNFPEATMRNVLGAEIIQSTLTINASERLFQIGPRVTPNLFCHTFNIALCSYIDGQRDAGKTIVHAIESFCKKYDISEDNLSLKTALKIYDRYKKT